MKEIEAERTITQVEKEVRSSLASNAAAGFDSSPFSKVKFWHCPNLKTCLIQFQGETFPRETWAALKGLSPRHLRSSRTQRWPDLPRWPFVPWQPPSWTEFCRNWFRNRKNEKTNRKCFGKKIGLGFFSVVCLVFQCQRGAKASRSVSFNQSLYFKKAKS